MDHPPPAPRGGRAALANALHLQETRAAWPGLSTYERFEQVVSLVLTASIGLVIVAALVNLTFRILGLVVGGLLDPAEHTVPAHEAWVIPPSPCSRPPIGGEGRFPAAPGSPANAA